MDECDLVGRSLGHTARRLRTSLREREEDPPRSNPGSDDPDRALLDEVEAEMLRTLDEDRPSQWSGRNDTHVVVDKTRPVVEVGDDVPEIPGGWDRFNSKRGTVLRQAASVGRVVVTASGSDSAVGTAFRIAPGYFMTNRHVVRDARAWMERHGEDGALELRLRADRAPIPVVGVVVLEEDGPDVALLEVTPRSLPGAKPLVLASSWAGSDGDVVYVIGFPSTLTELSRSEAGDVAAAGVPLDRRAVSAGHVLDRDSGRLSYDATTVGGNSGSPVFDLESGLVVGLHVGGDWGVRNVALELAPVLASGVLARDGLVLATASA